MHFVFPVWSNSCPPIKVSPVTQVSCRRELIWQAQCPSKQLNMPCRMQDTILIGPELLTGASVKKKYVMPFRLEKILLFTLCTNALFIWQLSCSEPSECQTRYNIASMWEALFAPHFQTLVYVFSRTCTIKDPSKWGHLSCMKAGW